MDDPRIVKTLLQVGGKAAAPLADSAPLVDSAARSGLETICGAYRARERIGGGPSTDVYRAERVRDGEVLVVKLLTCASESHPRLLREAGILATIRHPCVVPLVDSGVHRGRVFFVMPLLNGETLAERFARNERLPLRETIALVANIASGLAATHAKGVFHGCIDPDRVFLSKRQDGGFDARLRDFGLGARVETEVPRAPAPKTLLGPGPVGAGLLVAYGDQAYRAPESLLGEPVDARTDVYGLAMLVYRTLTGRSPFEHADATEVTSRVLRSNPAPLMREDVEGRVPEALDRAVRAGLAKDPKDRPKTPADFASSLWTALVAASPPPPPAEAIVVVPPPLARSPRLWSALLFGIVAVTLVALVRWFQTLEGPEVPVVAAALAVAPPVASAPSEAAAAEPLVASAAPEVSTPDKPSARAVRVSSPPNRTEPSASAVAPAPMAPAPPPAPVSGPYKLDDLKTPFR